jgi:hypothetical protein
VISTRCIIRAITNRDTIWSELEAVVLAVLVLGRKMRQLWVILESARSLESIEIILELPGGRGVHGTRWRRT